MKSENKYALVLGLIDKKEIVAITGFGTFVIILENDEANNLYKASVGISGF